MNNKNKFKLRYIFIGVISLWAVCFIADVALDVRVASDYDDTLAFSTPSFMKGFESGYKNFSDDFWKVVYDSIDLEKTKKTRQTILLFARSLGIKVDIISARKDVSYQPLADKWGWLVHHVFFTKDKRGVLSRNRYIFFLGDSDSDIDEAQKAGVLGIRILRHPDSSYKENYNPGKYGEFIVPYSLGPGLPLNNPSK